MKPRLKICGMREADNIMDVAALKPDYMGFIFYEKSKRFVGSNFSVPSKFPQDIKRVGVFVNEKTEKILDIVSKHKLDYVQLHGDEPPIVCMTLKTNRIGVIKVLSVDASFDFTTAKPYQEYSDFFLFDTKSETYGGTGKSFDWSLLKMYNEKIPFFLSGGISFDNIQDVRDLLNMNIHAIDVNSGVERIPGLKDVTKIKSIINILNSSR